MTQSIQGTNGNDTINGTSKSDTIFGKGGNDTINAGKGDDVVDGGSGNDTIDGGEGNDLLDGGTGNDTIDGGTGNDLIDGGSGDDVLRGGAGWDAICGGDGNDTITGGTGNDLIKGGRGTDTAVFSGTYASYTITPSLFNTLIVVGQDGTDLLLEVEFLKFDDGTYNVATGTFTPSGPVDQTIIGTPFNDDGVSNPALIGGAGNDTINALAGDDILIGNGGNDTLNGDAGRDRMTGGAGNDTLNGGADFDTAIYTDAAEAISVNLGAGIVTGGASTGTDTLTGTEGIKGSAFADTYDASSFSATSANGGGVGYSLSGGIGPLGNFNEFEGNGGNDTITGNGNTRISYQNATGAVVINLQLGTAAGDASVGNDVIVGGVRQVRGSNFNDTMTGRSDNGNSTEMFDGWGGNDFIDGNGGFDRVRYDNQNIAGPNGIIVNLAAGTVTGQDAAATAVVGFDDLRSIESVRGSNANDTFNATGFTATSTNGGGVGDQNNFNEFEGMGGDDTVTGNGNTRVAFYNATAGVTVTISGFTGGGGVSGTSTGNSSVGNDAFSGVSEVRGSTFNDTLTGFNNGTASFEIFDGWAGDDFIDGGLGIDRVRYDASDGVNAGVPLTAGMMFDMDAGIASGLDASATFHYGTDTLRGIEAIRGTGQADIYDATGFSASSTNAGGSNTFNEFEGGGGNDQITGNGDTRISYQNAGGSVTVNLALGNTAGSHGSVGNDSIGPGVNAIRGSNNFGDTLIGSNNPAGTVQFFEGMGGNDTIDGAGGLDVARYDNNGVARVAATIVDGLVGTVTVTAPGVGTDTISNVEVLRFTDAFQLTSAGQNANLLSLGMPPGTPLFGTSLNEMITVGTGQANRLIDLALGSDTLNLGQFGTPTYFLNLANVEFITSTGGIENVTLVNVANGLDVDLAAGFDTLTLAAGNNVATVRNVETLNAFGSGNDTITFYKDASVNQIINLGFGINVLNLAGADGDFSMTLSGGPDFTVNGQTTAIDENLNVLNAQSGTTFDLGAGTNDELHLNTLTGPGMNNVKVLNTEFVFGDLDESDQITVLGNTAGTTVVTGGSGPDQILLSSDVEHIRFTSTGDSTYDLPFAGFRDVVTGFDADEDKFVFDNIPGTIPANFNWQLINFGGGNIILVDIDGGGTVDPMATGGYSGYEMAIQVNGLTGTLDDTDFIVI